MRFKILLTLVIFALLFGTTPARTQTGVNQKVDPSEERTPREQDQKVIDDFIVTRGVSFEEPGKKSPSPPPRAGGSSASVGGANKGSAGGASVSKGSSSSKGSTAQKKPPRKGVKTAGDGTGNTTGHGGGDGSEVNGAQIVDAVLRPIGLGYTIFMKDQTGGLLPVDPAREYKSGDRIAIVLEPNTDGYIYIFNAENDRDPMMLFPNSQLDGGANLARAHVRETYPSDSNYAFEFDSNAAIEHIYVVVSRRPLDGVLAGDALAEFCKNKEECYWRPSAEQWARIKSGAAGGRVIEAKNGALLAQSRPQSVAPSSLQRGIKVKKDEPAPAVVRVNDSPQTDTLVTVIKLVHK